MSIHQNPKEVAMSALRSIEIDFDVHKAIEAERKSFSETPNDVLRRMLALGQAMTAPPPPSVPGQRAWMGDGVTLPHGTLLQMSYNGRSHDGQIVDGKWVVEGTTFDSPSGAASGTALTREGKHPSLDGWIYWRAKRPSETKWTLLNHMRVVRIEDIA